MCSYREESLLLVSNDSHEQHKVYIPKVILCIFCGEDKVQKLRKPAERNCEPTSTPDSAADHDYRNVV